MMNIASFLLLLLLLYGNAESKLHHCRNDCQFVLKFDDSLHIPENIYCPRVLDDVCNVILLFDYTKQTYTVTFSATSPTNEQTDERVIYTEEIDITKNSIQLTAAVSCLYDDDCDYTYAIAQIKRWTRWRYNGKSIVSKLRSIIGSQGPVDRCYYANGTMQNCLFENRASCLAQVDNLNKTVLQSCYRVNGAGIYITDNVGYPNISKNRQSSTMYRCTNQNLCNSPQTIEQVNRILLDFDLQNADGTLARDEPVVDNGAPNQQILKWTTIGSAVMITIYINIGLFSRSS